MSLASHVSGLPAIQPAADDDHDHAAEETESDSSHAVYIGKMVAIPVIFVIVLASALLPWLLAKSPRARVVMALAVCLSAGAMLGIGMLHTLPEAREVWEEYEHEGHDHSTEDAHAVHALTLSASASAAAAAAQTRAHIAMLLSDNSFESQDELAAALAAIPNAAAVAPVIVVNSPAERRPRSTLYSRRGTAAAKSRASEKAAAKAAARAAAAAAARARAASLLPRAENAGHDHDHTEGTDTTTGPGAAADETAAETEETESEAAHDHGVAYPEMIACLTLLFLFSLEHMILQFLVKRNSGHLAHCEAHGHGGGHAHGHGHAHAHKHAHSHAMEGDVEMVARGDSVVPHCQLVPAHSGDSLSRSASGHAHGGNGGDAEGDASPIATPVEGLASSVSADNGDALIALSSSSSGAVVPIAGEPAAEVDTAAAAAAVGDDADPNAGLEVRKDQDLTTEQQKNAESVRLATDAVIATLAITIHCVFNGLALGADSSNSAAFWTFFGATVGHKFVDGFAAGTTIWRGKLSKLMTVVVVFMVAFATPLGIIIGYTVARVEGALARAVIMSISCGSFLFVALFELMPAGFAQKTFLWARVLALFVGFGIVTVIARWA